MKRLLCLLLTLVPLCGCAAAQPAAYHSAVGFYFDTVVTLSGYCEEEILKDALLGCAAYEKLLSKTVEGSDVWRVNHAAGQPVAVSADTMAVLRMAQDVAAASNGAFDVTIAAASALWDFTGESFALPDPAALAAAVRLCDYTKLILSDGTVTLPAGMQIDLGGVAKGYIADRIAQRLREAGVRSALLSFGGNIVSIGTKPDGQAWRVGVKDPADIFGTPAAVLCSSDASVVTSGTYERFFTLDGVRYHHILDTRTGMPVQNGLASVTVAGPDSALCDALSTACFALGPEAGLALAARYGVEAVFIGTDGSLVASEGMNIEYLTNG